ncbi:hypothetical protein VTG60DRAFT_2248 [Thermothelomyces hinnuleus]
MNLIPGLSLRVSAEEEDIGLDDGQLGEFAYDYVEITRHIDGAVTGTSGSPPHSIKGGIPEKTCKALS